MLIVSGVKALAQEKGSWEFCSAAVGLCWMQYAPVHCLAERQNCYKRRGLGEEITYTVSQKNVPPLAFHNFDAHELILTFFGRNVTNKVGNQKTLYYATSNNLCFCTTWQNAETRKSHISHNWIVLHTQCTCALSSWKKKIVICDVFDSA